MSFGPVLLAGMMRSRSDFRSQLLQARRDFADLDIGPNVARLDRADETGGQLKIFYLFGIEAFAPLGRDVLNPCPNGQCYAPWVWSAEPTIPSDATLMRRGHRGCFTFDATT